MKFFLLILPGLLLFECLQGSTLPQGRPTRALNTTLRTNFSGIYQRKNPCCGTEVETSSYKASHELHHHTKDDGWSDYTHKCSAIIRNFLQTIGNLIKFNHDPNGSFNFYLNTSISQKQRLTGDPKSCESLPTIVIEATDCKIPINSCCEISKGSNVKYKSAEDRKHSTDQCQDEKILSLPDFSAQEDCKSKKAVSRPHAKEAITSVPPQSTTYYPGRDWFKAEESSCENDKYKFPTGFASSADDFSPAALYQLSRDTKSPYEPKPKIFKTSLKLTPQADPENGTIKPRIHYMAANLVPDPSHTEPASQSETEGPFIQSGSSGPFMPLPFPEAPIHPTSPSLPLEYPPQVPQPPAASAFQPYANPNEPAQLSVIGQPEPQVPLSSSQTEKLAEAAAPFQGEPFTAPVDLSPLPAGLPKNPSPAFILEDRTPVGRINDTQFSFEPLQSQPATTVNYNPDIPNVQSTPLAPQFLDVSSRPTLPNSRSDLTISSEGQAQPNLFQLPRQRPQEDLPSQVSQPAVDFPGQSPKVNGEALNYPTTLSRPPTAGDLSIESKPQTFTPNFGNPLNLPVPRDDHFNAQQISPPYQQFPGQLPYNNHLLSSVPPSRDSFRTDGDISLTTPLPPFQSGFTEVPNYSSLVPGESKEESSGRPTPLASQPSVNPYLASIPANGLPYSDSLITPSPGLDGRVEPADSYLGQQPTSDGQSTKQFHSSSVTTTVEETVTLNEKQTTPGFVLDATAEQLRGRASDNFNPSSTSGSDLSSYKAAQQFPPVLPNYPRPQLPGPGLFPNNVMENDSQPLGNPNQLTPGGSINVDHSTIDSQITDPTLNSNNSQVPRVPETSQTVPMPFQQESQLPEPDLPINGLQPMTTPIPFAPNPQKTILNSPISQEGKPTFAAIAIYPDAGPTTSPPTRPAQSYTPGEYNFQSPTQQSYSTPEPVPANEPLVGYFDPTGTRAPPASDSFVRSDFLTAAAPQPLTGNVNGITSVPDNSLTYGTVSVDQLTDSPQQKRPPLNPENNPAAAGQHGRVWSGSQITEGVPPYLPSTVTPPPEVYAPLQEQQPLDSASSERFQEPLPSSEQFSADQISQLPAVTENPEAVLSQEQFGNDQSRRRNPPDVYSVTSTGIEKNFQAPFQSTTPVYGIQSPIEGGSKRVFEPKTENKFEGRIPINPLGSLELLDGKQMTDSAMSLQPISSDSFPENKGPSDQYSPNIFPEYVDGTTPANFPSAAGRPNQEFVLNRPSAFAIPLPAGEPSSGITPGYPDFQQSSQNSEQFSDFNPQQPSPGLPTDTSKPQLPAVPLAGLPLSPAPKSQYQNDNFDQAVPVNSIMTTSSINDLSVDSLPAAPLNSLSAFPLSQDAGTTPSTDSLVEYTLSPTFQTGENRFFTSSTPQPTLPVQTFDKSTQTIPPQPSEFVPPSSTVSQSQGSDLVLKTPQETSESSFGQPVLFETNTVQPPTSLQVGPALETIPSPTQPSKTGLQYTEEEITLQSQPQVFDGTSPQFTLNPQSVDNAANLQETPVFGRREKSRLDDFGQDINNLPVAADSLSLPQRSSYQTTSIEETTTTSVLNSNQFSAGSTEAPFVEPLQTLAESTPAGEIAVTQQQSFPSPDSQQLPNYTDRSSDELSSSFAPLVSQQISTPNIQTPANADRSSVPFLKQTQSLDLSTNNLLPSTTAAPEMALTYPDQPTSHDSRENVHSVVSDSVESFSSQQEPQRQVDPVHFSLNPPSSLSAEFQTLSQDNSNFQQRHQLLPERAAVVNLQGRPYGPYSLPPPVPLTNSYNGNIPTPPRAPLLDGHPSPNYMRPPLSDSENRPPFYGQQPPSSPPLNSFSKSESTVQEVTESETISHSSGPQTQPRLVQPNVPFNPEGQLASANVPPAYLQNPANSNGPMPPFAPNYNAFRPQDRYRYFGPLPLPPNYDPRLRLSNQQNFPPYSNAFPLRDQGPVPPPMNQIINDRQIINPREKYPLIRPSFQAQPGREVGFLNEGQAFRQQTEDRLPVDSRPETPLRPFGQPPTSPAQRPPPAQEKDLPNPLLQALQSHLVVPTQEQPPQHASFPGRSDHNEPLSFDTKNASQIENAPASPPYPGQWNPPPATNFVNLQQNTAFDALRGVPNGPQPHPHALVPDQTTPSNKPDPVSTGRSDIMASPLRNSFYADRMRLRQSELKTSKADQEGVQDGSPDRFLQKLQDQFTKVNLPS